MKNMTVWRTGVELINDKLSFYDIHQAEIPQDLYDKFKWNKLIRLDIFQNNRIIFLSQDKLMLEGLWNGWHFHKDIYDVESFINRMNSAKEQYERELSEQS